MDRYWIWLAQRGSINPHRKLELVERFGGIVPLYEARDYTGCGLTPAGVSALLDKDLSGPEAILAACWKRGAKVLCAGDHAFPRRLLAIPDPPLVLYYKGTLPDFDREAAIGVVGTRSCSEYGLQSAEKLGREITAHGGLVVSGMAAGVDSQASRGALQAGGPTVGVLGCAIDRVYPAANHRLYAQVERKGCLISEYPPGVSSGKWAFPQRNRIISGLSLGVLVVEAPQKSGTMITADFARQQGRDLFAVPGPIDSPNCAGSNALLRDGALMAACGWDVVGEYAAQFPEKLHKDAASQPPTAPPAPPAPRGQNAREDQILAILAQGEKTIDQLIAATGLRAQEVTVAVTMLEIRGAVKSLPGRRVKLS